MVACSSLCMFIFALIVLSIRAPSGKSITVTSSVSGHALHSSFALSRAPYDWVEIAEVNALVEKLPQVAEAGRPVPVWSPEGPALIQRVPELSYPIRLPPNAVVKYELDGVGSMELAGNVVKLRNGGTAPIVWRNFRVVPR